MYPSPIIAVVNNSSSDVEGFSPLSLIVPGFMPPISVADGNEMPPSAVPVIAP
jgi:hypothetical protein